MRNHERHKVHGKCETKVGSDCRGRALSWSVADGVIDLALHRAPCNELGSAALEELEKFVTDLERVQAEEIGRAHV